MTAIVCIPRTETHLTFVLIAPIDREPAGPAIAPSA